RALDGTRDFDAPEIREKLSVNLADRSQVGCMSDRQRDSELFSWLHAPLDSLPLCSHRGPGRVEVHGIPRPGQPFLGAGEAAQGPAAGALSNAVANAIGMRIRDIPFTRA